MTTPDVSLEALQVRTDNARRERFQAVINGTLVIHQWGKLVMESEDDTRRVVLCEVALDPDQTVEERDRYGLETLELMGLKPTDVSYLGVVSVEAARTRLAYVGVTE